MGGQQTILIAEPWDCGGLYQVGTFPNWDVWGEWNGKYRDIVRSASPNPPPAPLSLDE